MHYHIKCYKDLASGAQAKIFIFWLKASPEPPSQFYSKETTKNTEPLSQRIHLSSWSCGSPFFDAFAVSSISQPSDRLAQILTAIPGYYYQQPYFCSRLMNNECRQKWAENSLPMDFKLLPGLPLPGPHLCHIEFPSSTYLHLRILAFLTLDPAPHQPVLITEQTMLGHTNFWLARDIHTIYPSICTLWSYWPSQHI